MPIIAGDHNDLVSWGAASDATATVITGDPNSSVTFDYGDYYTADTLLEDINHVSIVSIDNIYIEIDAGFSSDAGLGTVIWVPA